MIVNIKGIGRVNFPGGMTQDAIRKALIKNFARPERDKKEELNKLETIKTIVKGVVSDVVKKETIVPDVKVEIEPVFEVTNDAPDMTPIADAIKSLERQETNIDIHIPEKPNIIDIEVTERDSRGNISRLRMTGQS